MSLEDPTKERMPVIPIRMVIFPGERISFDTKSHTLAPHSFIFCTPILTNKKKDDANEVGVAKRGVVCIVEDIEFKGDDVVTATLKAIYKAHARKVVKEDGNFYVVHHDIKIATMKNLEELAKQQERFLNNLIKYMNRADVETQVKLLHIFGDFRLELVKTGERENFDEIINKLSELLYKVGAEIMRPQVRPLELLMILSQDTLEAEFAAANQILERLISELKEDPKLKAVVESESKTEEEPNEPVSTGNTGIDRFIKRLKEIEKYIDDKTRVQLFNLIKQLEGSSGSDHTNLNGLLEIVLMQIPWGLLSTDPDDLKEASETLDKSHYGLQEVKDRIVEYLAVRKERGRAQGNILCIVGPPGSGKTSITKSIAQALGRAYVRRALGGVHDEAEIRGHRRTYIGAFPGMIAKGLIEAECFNPVFVLDEMDKLGRDFRGRPDDALLEVLDPKQNSSFRDHYLDIPIDLSQVFFIATANNLENIPEPLRNRMEIIRVPGYFVHEKIQIAREYIIPEVLDNHGLKGKLELEISDETIQEIIEFYTMEAGVRDLERCFSRIVRKLVRARQLDGRTETIAPIMSDRLEAFLGRPLRQKDEYQDTLIGEAMGLAVSTSNEAEFGDVLPIQCSLVPGHHGKELSLTGRLGDVMRESAKLALSRVREIKFQDQGFLDKLKDCMVHVHAPAGATPKDGPSAGVAMVLAIMSRVSGQPLRQRLAMTGEIDNKDRVLPIGGVMSKVLAAERHHMKDIILPKSNEEDYQRVPEQVRVKLNAHFVSTIQEAIQIAFEGRV